MLAVQDFYKKIFETTHEQVLREEGDDGSIFNDLDLVLERSEEEEESLRWEAERIRKSYTREKFYFFPICNVQNVFNMF